MPLLRGNGVNTPKPRSKDPSLCLRPTRGLGQHVGFVVSYRILRPTWSVLDDDFGWRARRAFEAAVRGGELFYAGFFRFEPGRPISSGNLGGEQPRSAAVDGFVQGLDLTA